MLGKYGKYLLYSILLFFSLWLSFHTFSYDSKTNDILIGAKAWSDFGGYVPQIRSFSKGYNWPPQYPLFPGEPTRYHFLFYWFSAALEKLGLRIDYALNLPSAAGFFFLCLGIMKLGKELFKSQTVAVLSVIFFLFNGSFSFLDFFQKNPLGPDTFQKLIHNTQYPSFGPWNGSEITAFWNLNIYTNQRHLAASYALMIGLILILLSQKKKLLYLTGLIVGCFLLLNQAVFAISVGFVSWYFLAHSKVRKPILISLLGVIPWIFLYQFMSHAGKDISIDPGFLAPRPLTIMGFVRFWILNIGLHSALIPLGVIFSPKIAKLLFVPLLVLFVVSNVFKLSPDMINNHKFLNFFVIVGGTYSAFFVVKMWSKGVVGRLFSIVAFLLLIAGGVVDFFPLKNDYFIRVSDYRSNPDVNFFLRNTPLDSVILNSTWFYHPASIAGRFVYNGYSYFVWSFGYDQKEREDKTVSIYQSNSKSEACSKLIDSSIDFVELGTRPESFINPNYEMWYEEFIPVYSNQQSGMKVYSVKDNCINEN